MWVSGFIASGGTSDVIFYICSLFGKRNEYVGWVQEKEEFEIEKGRNIRRKTWKQRRGIWRIENNNKNKEKETREGIKEMTYTYNDYGTN